jgi:hypothetical protein
MHYDIGGECICSMHYDIGGECTCSVHYDIGGGSGHKAFASLCSGLAIPDFALR